VRLGLSFVKRAPVLSTAAFALFGAFALSGCDDTYPASMEYGVRNDPLVLQPFKNYAPPRFDPPGHLEYTIAHVRASGDEVDKKSILEPANLTPGQKQEIYKSLTDLFGTPHHPTVNGVDDDVKAALKVEDATLAKGADLYRLHCLHCHGLTGNGRGPTAPWVNPHPRDYRSGIFKFTSSKQPDKARKPRREDLLRTLRQGVEGTSMPSFGLFSDEQLNELASYVMHLSLRGQVEFQVMQDLLNKESGETIPDADIADRAKEWVGGISGWWVQAEKELIAPEIPPQDLAESVQRGFKLFQKDGRGCMSCHLDYGRQNNYLNDSWGTIVRALDLTRGEYRGGRRPIDLYWRIHSGVNGANMPASSDASSKDIWDLVNFLQVLPYPQMRKQYSIDINQ
jgi:mono/diheme cytochrome c family protein